MSTDQPNSEPLQKQKLEYKLKPGQKVFEIYTATQEIKAASYKKIGGLKSLIERKECVYIPALNKVHAKKKFDNIIKSFETTSLEDLKKDFATKNWPK